MEIISDFTTTFSIQFRSKGQSFTHIGILLQMPPKTKTHKDVASKAKNSKKTASTDHDENEGKVSAKTPRNFIPEPTKAMIVNEIKHRYRYLNGAFDHKHTATQRLTKWNEILDICLADPEAKKHISSAKDVKDKFQKWKQNLNTKVSKENYTGASPADHWTESEKVIYNIVNEFADYRMSLKKASPDAGLQHLKALKASKQKTLFLGSLFINHLSHHNTVQHH